MPSSSLYVSRYARAGEGRLWLAIFIAGLIHCVVLLSVGFEFPHFKETPKRLEIAIVTRPKPQPKTPKQAEFLANEAQTGPGRPTVDAAPPPAEPEPETVSPAPVATPKPAPRPPAPMRATPKPVLAQPHESPHKAPPPRPEAPPTAEPDTTSEPVAEPTRRLDPGLLSQQIAEYTTALNHSVQSTANKPRTAYINSINAHRYQAAAYEQAWQAKVERIGNLNYPDAARRRNLSGDLLLSVAIRADGTIYSIKVRRSSGEAVLDDAAERIVRLASPFAPFPPALRQEWDVLVITRTWKFMNDHRLETSR